MEFLNISDIKLKVTLTPEDAKSFGIDSTGGDFSGVETRRAIRKILAMAESECGFSADGGRILVQLYPLPDGSCELLVTRLVSMSRRDRSVIAESEGLSIIEERQATYRFDSREELIRAARTVRRGDVVADLYRDDLGRYYINAREELSDGISELEVFVEFGERLSALPIPVISEYGTLLAKGNAIAFVLSESFEST